MTSQLGRRVAFQKHAPFQFLNFRASLTPTSFGPQSLPITRPTSAAPVSPGPGLLVQLVAAPSFRSGPAPPCPAGQREAPTSTPPAEAPEQPVTMPDTDLELAAQRVRQLEAEAIAMHDLAQALNKEGRFEEAHAAYASMHQLEDEASQLAARVGCVACVLGEPGQAQEQPSLCNMDPAVLAPYQQLHPALPWDVVLPRGSPPLSEQQQPQPPQPQPSGGALLLEARARGAVVGSALADAAAMGVHWVYDLAVLDEVERGMAAAAAGEASSCSPGSGSGSGSGHPVAFGLEFTEPPRSPFYSYASGRNSPYGEQTLVLLRSLAEGAGDGGGSDDGATVAAGLHCGHYAELFSRTFGPESGFDGYRDVSTKGFLRNYARGFPPPLCGANDAQANCVARLAPLVAAFGAAPPSFSSSSCSPASASASLSSAVVAEATGGGGGDPLLRCVELATRVTQNTDAAVAWASAGAVVLEQLLLGSSAEAAVQHVVQDLESPAGRLSPYVGVLGPEIRSQLARALELRATPVPAAVAALGRNCHMPNALTSPLQVVLHAEYMAEEAEAEEAAGRELERKKQGGGEGGGGDPRVVGARLPAEAYVWGVRLAVREGGCCASRAAYAGACLGALVAAALGEGRGAAEVGVPEGWLLRYPAAAQVQTWAEALLAARRRVTAARRC